jgi:hypothetical protein
MWYEAWYELTRGTTDREKRLFSLVAGERYRLSPCLPDLRYFIQSYA